jgi:O-antigen/teichoic acid export membrane protein
MKNNGVIAAAQVIWFSLALFIVYRISAQVDGVATLGAWSTAVALAGLITIADLGLPDVMVREVAHARGSRDWPRVKGLFWGAGRSIALAAGIACLLAVPVLALTLRTLIPSLGDTGVTLAAGAVATMWLRVVSTGAAGILEAFGRYDLKAVAAFVSGAVAIVSAYIAASIVPGLTLVVAVVAEAGVNTLVTLAATLYVLKGLPGAPRPATRAERNAMLRIGLNARIGGLAGLGFDPVVRFLLLRFGGAHAAGLYEIAYRLVIQLRAVLVASTQVMVPRLTHERASGAPALSPAVAQITASLLRLSGPALWGILIVLPLLSAAMLGHVEGMLLIYGLALTLAWLVNAISVPAYFGNFVDGDLRTNRTSHVVMLLAAAALGAPAGLIFNGLGVVISTSLAIVLGSAVLLVSRRRDLATMSIGVTNSDFVVNIVGLLGAAAANLVSTSSLGVEQRVMAALLAAAVYAAVSTRFITGIVREHLRQVAS